MKSRLLCSLWVFFSSKKMVVDSLNPPLQREVRFVFIFLIIFPSSNCFLGRWSQQRRENCGTLWLITAFLPSFSPHLFHMTFAKANMMLNSSVARERKCLAIRDQFDSSKNDSISSPSMLRNIMNTLKHFPKYFQDKKDLILLSYQHCNVLEFLYAWFFQNLPLTDSTDTSIAHTFTFTAQSHKKADQNNNSYLLVLGLCCTLNKRNCSSELLQRHHRRELHYRPVVIYHKHRCELAINNCDAQVQ